jgi:hypothetical protein
VKKRMLKIRCHNRVMKNENAQQIYDSKKNNRHNTDDMERFFADVKIEYFTVQKQKDQRDCQPKQRMRGKSPANIAVQKIQMRPPHAAAGAGYPEKTAYRAAEISHIKPGERGYPCMSQYNRQRLALYKSLHALNIFFKRAAFSIDIDCTGEQLNPFHNSPNLHSNRA